MNDKRMKTSVTTEEVSSPPDRAAVWGVTIGGEHRAALKTTVLVLENGL